MSQSESQLAPRSRQFVLHRPLSRGRAGSQAMQGLLFDVGENVVAPASGLLYAEAAIWIANPGISPPAGRKPTVCLLMLQTSQGKLLEVVAALRSPRGFTGCLYRREQQRDQDADDRDDDQELHKGKTGVFSTEDTRFLVELVHRIFSNLGVIYDIIPEMPFSDISHCNINYSKMRQTMQEVFLSSGGIVVSGVRRKAFERLDCRWEIRY